MPEGRFAQRPSQLPCVQQLWLDCVAAEQFGKQERKILTNLSDKSFRAAKLALEDKGLFRFIKSLGLKPRPYRTALQKTC